MAERTIAFRIDEELHKRIKMRLIETNKTLKNYVIDLIVQDLNNADETKKASAVPQINMDMQAFWNEFMDFVLKKHSEEIENKGGTEEKK